VARQVEDGYNELLKVLKNNPPYIESHVKALEIEVQLAQKQFEDMCEHRNNLYHETEAANENKVPCVAIVAIVVCSDFFPSKVSS